MRPLVSTLIVNRNYGKYLRQAIQSILAQDYPKESIEIIVVDYGSTDGSQEIIQEFGTGVNGIYLENGTFLQAINTGLANARGKYIAFLGADDMWLPTKVSRQVGFMERFATVGLVYSDMVVISEDNQVLSNSFWNSYSIKPLRGKVTSDLVKENFVSGGTVLVRSDLKDVFFPIPEGRGFDRAEDWWIAFNVSLHSEIDFIEEPLTLYRFHGENITLGSGAKSVTYEDTKLMLLQEVLTRKTMLERLSEFNIRDEHVLKELNLLLESKKHELEVFQSLEEGASSLLEVLRKNRFNLSTVRALGKGIMLKTAPRFYNHLRFLKNQRLIKYELC